VASSVREEEGQQLDSSSPVDDPCLPPVLNQQESGVETGEDSVSTAGTNLPVKGDDDWLLGEFCFDEDIFASGKRSEGSSKTRSEKRMDRYNHARVQRSHTGDLELDISKQEFRKLQDEDSSIQSL